jgi:hypothetical protein
MTVHYFGHLTGTRSVVGDHGEIVDSVAAEVVVHQTYRTVTWNVATASSSLARRLEVDNVLQTKPFRNHCSIASNRFITLYFVCYSAAKMNSLSLGYFVPVN